MPIMTISSREFNQGTSKAKRASVHGPVFITDRGQPAYVLLTIREYQKITKKEENIIDLISMPDIDNIDFKPPRVNKKLFHPVDLF